MSDGIEAVIAKLGDRPRSEVVKELASYGNVDTLTQFKMKLVNNSRQCKNVPKGEYYIRRKPKGGSVYVTLEEHLASDICEISDFLDSGTVSNELRDMFKSDCSQVAVNLASVNNDSPAFTSWLTCSIGQSLTTTKSPAMFTPPRGLTDMRNQLASLQPSFMLFWEQSKAEITELQGRVNGPSSVVQSQSKEIANLKDENMKLWQICIQSHATMPNNYSQELVENEISNHVSDDTTYASHVAKKTKKTNDLKAKHKPSSNKSTESEQEVVVAVNDVLEKPALNPATCVVASHSTNNRSSSVISRDNATNIEQVTEVSDETDVEFVGVKHSRIKTQRFFLSGINEKVSSKQILNYLQDRQIIPTLLCTGYTFSKT